MNIEQTIESIRVMQAFVDGKEVECWHRGLEGWDTTNNPSWNWMDCTFRIKPTPVLRPWTADEVPLGAWMRFKLIPSERYLITQSTLSLPLQQWFQDREHSIDGGVTWKPCGVVEEAK